MQTRAGSLACVLIIIQRRTDKQTADAMLRERKSKVCVICKRLCVALLLLFCCFAVSDDLASIYPSDLADAKVRFGIECVCVLVCA